MADPWQLLVESSLKLELAYYNSLLAAWEPIIECVERRDAGMVSFSPWELHMKVSRAPRPPVAAVHTNAVARIDR